MQNDLSNTIYTIVITICFIVGITFGINFINSFFVIIFPVLALSVVFFIRKDFIKIVIAGVIIFIFGFYYSIYRTPQIGINDISRLSPQHNITVIGNVSSEPRSRSKDKLKFDFKVEKAIINGKILDYPGNILVTVLDKNRKFETIEIGQKLKLTGNLYKPKTATNPTQFDYGSYLLNRGISSCMFVLWNNYQILSQSESLNYKFLNHLNYLKDHIQSIHQKAISRHEAQLLGGIVLGERAIPMDQSIRQNFINSGLVHILAASGINVALLGLAWIFITARLGFSNTVQIVGGMIIVLFYALLTGLPPSVMRASLMLELIFAGKLINKDANMIAIISFVAALLLLINPYYINDIGFQLSFITAFGLILSVPVFQKYITTLPQALAMLVLIPLIAQIWAFPIILYNFHSFSTYSVVANFFAMPLVALITYGGFLSSVLSIIPIIGISITTLIDKILSPVLSLLLFIAEYISRLPFSLEHFSFNSIIYVFLIYIIIAVILYAMWKEFKLQEYLIIIFSIIIIYMGLSFIYYPDKNLKITFFDVGDADCILIKTPSNKHILIDGGYRIRNSFSAADWILEPYFYSNQIRNIDAIILTHPQSDHIGGIPEILEDFQVNSFYDGGFSSTSKSYNELLKTIMEKNIPYKILRKNDRIVYDDGVKLTILSPEEKVRFAQNHNHNSLLIRLDYRDFSALLTGDTEKDIINDIDISKIDIDLLKVGHHGSKKSIDERYLELTTPDIAVISAGREKIHPAKNVLKLLKNNKTKTLITKKTGAITISSDGKTFNINTFK